MPVKICALASLPHYRNHIEPVMAALPDDMRGVIYDKPDQLPDDTTPVVVAGFFDLKRVRTRRPIVFLEHGAGQTYDGDNGYASRHACYSGSTNSTYRRVSLFICPNDVVAHRWNMVRPDTPAVAIGCPRLDRWHTNPQPATGETTIGWTWHWGADIGVSEATGALRYYRDHLPEIIASLSADGYKVVGHAHPRLGTSIESMWLDAGATWTADPDDLFEQASCLVADNTSLMYEFASLDRPVVALNAPWYRRRIEHGLRFWSAVPGPQADTPGEVADTVRLALADPAEIAAHRRDVTKMVYGHTDGLAAARAAAAIVATLG